jgi:single-stranded-DNA-specific exonuclease
MTIWNEHPPLEIPSHFSEYPDLIARTLIRRGIRDVNSAQAFLDPDSYTPAPATDLPGMDSALTRLAQAVKRGESICIWGDFDVDGQTATATLYQTLTALSANVTYHVPVRAKESHGVNLPKLAEIIDNGASLILTCDTGITAHQAVLYAQTRGVDFIITDHHDLPEGDLPAALAVVNPKMLASAHPLATLAGVGVACKLSESLLEQFPACELNPADLHDLAALGLVADIALLRGETRYLVQRGLRQLRQTARPGLKAIYELAELNPNAISESQIGFTIAPRLNALGRLGDANPAVELLTTLDPVRANVLATQLEGLNAQRKLLLEQVTGAAEAQLRADPSLLASPVIILHGAEWPAGVIGIAASRLVERYHKPALLLSGTPESGLRGSARSVDGLHITEAIRAASDILTNFGGHPMAAGVGLKAENLPALRRKLAKAVEEQLGTRPTPEAELTIDAYLPFDAPSFELAEQIEQLAPFGAGNPPILLATRNLMLASDRVIGKTGEHRRLSLSDEAGNEQTALWWGGGSEEIPEGKIDLAYTLRAGDYKGQRQLTLEVVDIRPAAGQVIEFKAPKRVFSDLRGIPNAAQRLQEMRAEDENALVWAEGAHKKQVDGKYRHELAPAETLIVWTTPASPSVWRKALEVVNPRRVVVFGIQPPETDAEQVIRRLAGILKFILQERQGKTSLMELAAAIAQTESLTARALGWLVRRGEIRWQVTDPNGILLTPGQPEKDSAPASMVELEAEFNEMRAWREMFGRMDLEF